MYMQSITWENIVGVFEFVIVARSYFTVDELSHGCNLSIKAVETIITECHSLFVRNVSSDETVENTIGIAHRAIADWMTNKHEDPQLPQLRSVCGFNFYITLNPNFHLLYDC
jgi:hypothetical protein